MKKIVIIDIDGTVSHIGEERAALLQDGRPIDLDAFYADAFDDKPVTHVLELVKHLDKKYRLVFCTGRSERARTKTLNWMDKHRVPCKTNKLLMRPDDDERPDHEVKPDLIRRHGLRFNEIAFVLEDRKSMVDKWRELGVPCFQVAEGGI